MLLSDLGTFLSRRGQANSGELFFWFAFFVSTLLCYLSHPRFLFDLHGHTSDG